jgi:sulfatase maturation enzyme AslB (radical SAM superfamily)
MCPPSVADLHTLELILTAACNLRCSYCYQNAKQNRHIEWDVVRAALDRLLASKCNDVTVLFIGGEPLLEFPTLVRATAYIAEHRRADMLVRHEIYTNGSLLGDRELEFLIEHGFHVQVSFDGVPAAQALRGERTFEKLDALNDTHSYEHRAFFLYAINNTKTAFYEEAFNIAITVTPRTIHLLADSIEYFLIDKRVHDLTIGPQITHTGDWKVERLGELEAAFSRIFSVSLRRYSETGDVPLRVFRKSHEGLRTAPSVCRVIPEASDDVSQQSC